MKAKGCLLHTKRPCNQKLLVSWFYLCVTVNYKKLYEPPTCVEPTP